MNVLNKFRAGAWLISAALALSTASATPQATAALAASSHPAEGVITFTLDFPESNPEHYTLTVENGGRARYECTAKVVEDSEEQSYSSQFEVTEENQKKIFEWAKQARFFEGAIDSRNERVAFTGTKTLAYRDGQRSTTARYNYSNLAAVRLLTALLQSIAQTQEYGRRLAYFHRYQKLALDEELKRMEAQARSNDLTEIGGVAPILQAIVDDASVINGVRARARELIEMGSGPASRR